MTESPEPMTTEELLSGMVTEEIEPGVYKVINDGVRDLLEATASSSATTAASGRRERSRGSVRSCGIFRLGGEIIDTQYEALDRTADGRLWAESLHTYDGERWTEHPAPTTDFDGSLLYNLGGTIWATWPDPQQPQQWAVARLDGDEWRLLDPL